MELHYNKRMFETKESIDILKSLAYDNKYNLK